jgi:diguanylate cyclase (GGDEF)-like protein
MRKGVINALDTNQYLYNATLLISSSLDLDTVLSEIVKQMVNAIDATSAYICTYDRITHLSKVVAEFYGPEAAPNERLSDLGKTYNLSDDFPEDINGLVEGKPMVDQITDPNLDKYQQDEMTRCGAKSVLTVPVQFKQETIAFAEIWESRDHRVFIAHEIELCMAIAQHAAVAIENARLHAETENRLVAQTALGEAGSAISSALDLNTVLNQIAEHMCIALDTTSSYICSWNGENLTSTVVAEFLGEHSVPKERSSDLGQSYRDEDDVKFIKCMLEGLADISQVDDPDITKIEKEHLTKYGAKTVLYIPLRIRGDLVAIAELWESRQKREFTQEEIYLATSIAQQAAIAIQNAQLYEQTVEEINFRKRIEKKLFHDAFHDELTGLPNRALLMDRLEQTLARSRRRKDYGYGVLFIDLDRFKIVNDSLGHSVGDELLRAVSKRISSLIRETDTFARIGGDEFSILLEEINGPTDVIHLASRILDGLNGPFNLSDNTIYIAASIGLTIGDDHYQSPEELLRDADIALFRAKAQGKNRYAVFDKEMHELAMATLRLEVDIRTAIRRNEFELHYQPIVSLSDRKIISFEALIRWSHPVRGLLSPLEFIPFAEESGLITSIDRWVIREICNQMAEWKSTPGLIPPRKVSANISGKHLRDHGLVEYINDVLNQTQINPNGLVLEITENAILDDIDSAFNILQDIKEMGIEIQLDDFGTGNSSLNLLRKLPIDAIKIDRSFISELNSRVETREIVRTIIQLGENLNKRIIAEGVETNNELEILQDLNCQLFGQGFLFGKPVSAKEVSSLTSRDIFMVVSADSA